MEPHFWVQGPIIRSVLNHVRFGPAPKNCLGPGGLMIVSFCIQLLHLKFLTFIAHCAALFCLVNLPKMASARLRDVGVLRQCCCIFLLKMCSIACGHCIAVQHAMQSAVCLFVCLLRDLRELWRCLTENPKNLPACWTSSGA